MKMIQWMFAAILICGTTVFTSCDNSSDNPVNSDPSEKTVPRISKIFKSGHLLMKRNTMGTWVTIREIENERALSYEFFWTGNRLDSIKSYPGDPTYNVTYDMEYDEQGRLVHDFSRGGNYDYVFEYDSKGRLSKMYFAILWDKGIYSRYVTSYIYEGDKLIKSIEEGSVYNKNGGPFTRTEEHVFTWDGDNVVAMSEVETDVDGYVKSDNYTVEYSANLNPFRNLLHFRVRSMGISSYDELWALSKNVPSRIISSETTLQDYECKTTGDLVTSFQTHTLAESETMYHESENDYDFEYLY
jgi:YD repeat-containing protein